MIKLFWLILITPVLVVAHPGGLDGQGGHFNRKTGEYHCHRATCDESASQGGETTPSGYNRKDWPHWKDLDGDCQNTRAEVLIRDSRRAVQFKDARQCSVTAGEWFGPYTGAIFYRASDVDIDHVVPLGHAHRAGGSGWPRWKKQQFANDPDNLLAVDDATNQEKGAQPPSQWMPPRREFWCEYLARWALIEDRYGLRKDALPAVSCGD